MEEVSDILQGKTFKFIHIVIHLKLPTIADCFANSV